MGGRKLYQDAKTAVREKRNLKLFGQFAGAMALVPQLYSMTLAAIEIVKCGSITCLWGQFREQIIESLPAEPHVFTAVGLLLLALYILFRLLLMRHTILRIILLVLLQSYLLAAALLFLNAGTGMIHDKEALLWLEIIVTVPLLLWFIWETPLLPQRTAKRTAAKDGSGKSTTP